MTTSTIWRQTGAWTGGTVAALALSPTFAQDRVILAATAAGLYRSLDGGSQWQSCQNGLSDPRITTVAFAPIPSMALAATADGRLFQTQDSGATWQERTGWAGLGLINVITFSPHFAQDQTIFVATAEGVFRSQDGGRAWESSTFGLLDLEILCLACAPNFAETELLWAGSALGGLYRSRNCARSWRDAGQGLPDMAIQCMVVSPHFAQDQTLYIGTESDGVYRSTDGGAQWQAFSPQLAGQSINALAISTDGQTLMAAGGAGIYRSTDGGQTWLLTTDALLALAITIAPDGRAFAGTYQTGIFCLPTQASAWQAMSAGLTAHVPPMALGNPAHTLYLLDVEGALTASTDGGHSWQGLNPHVAHGPIWTAALTLDAAAEPRLYVATAQALYVVHGANPNGAWQQSSLPEAANTPVLLAALPASATQSPLLLADETGKLYHSIDGGAQWQTVTAPWSSQQQLLTVQISPLDGMAQTFYALTAQPDPARGYLMQLWQTRNGGLDWQVLIDFYADMPAAAMALPLDPVEQPILVGVRHRLIKVYQSVDSIAWKADQFFLDNALRITSIVTTARYAEDRAIYVTTNAGVWQTADGGATWTPIGTGLEGRTTVAFWPGTADQAAATLELGGVLWQLTD